MKEYVKGQRNAKAEKKRELLEHLERHAAEDPATTGDCDHHAAASNNVTEDSSEEDPEERIIEILDTYYEDCMAEQAKRERIRIYTNYIRENRQA